MRFNRLLLPFLILGGLVCQVTAQEADDPRKPALFQRKPLPEDPRDDELRKLVKARFNTALKETEALWAVYQLGRSGLQPLQSAATNRLYPAGREALTAPAERVAFAEQYVDFAKMMEKYVQAKHEAGAATVEEMFQATYVRQDAEIQLVKTKREAKGAKP